jgi:Serine aminopeptidase, S33
VLGLIAVAPVVKGRTYMRELTALQAASSKLADDAAVEGVFQSGGFVMRQSTREALAQLDLCQLPQAPARQMLLIDRDDMPPQAAWVTAMEALGAEVDQVSLPGYAGMMGDPHHALVPDRMVDTSLQWLRQVCPMWAADCGHRPPAAPPVASVASVLMPLLRVIDGAGGVGNVPVSERALWLPDTPAFGIVTSPAQDSGQSQAGNRHAVLLLNAGSTRHIGPSRMSVDLARDWASQGLVVLRLDLAGIGDSDPRAGRPANLTYPHEAMADVAAAIALLRREHGVVHVHACGLCAGAYHALKAARDGMALASLTLINPLIYFNAEGLSLEADTALSAHQVHAATANYRHAMASSDKWLKLLKGQVKVGVLAQVVSSRARMWLAAAWRNVARALHWPLHDDLGTALRQLVAKGVRIEFLFSQDDPGAAMLEDQAGSMLAPLRRSGLFGVHYFAGADHVFTDLRLRQALLARVQGAVPKAIDTAAARA